MGSMLILESYKLYIRSNLSAIFKNIALRLVLLIHNIIADGVESKADPEPMPMPSLRLERFMNLHLFFASAIWEQLNELLVDEEALLSRIEEAFYAFESKDQEEAEATTAETTRGAEALDAAFVEKVRAFLGTQGFQNTSIDKLFEPSLLAASLTIDRYSACSLVRYGCALTLCVHDHCEPDRPRDRFSKREHQAGVQSRTKHVSSQEAPRRRLMVHRPARPSSSVASSRSACGSRWVCMWSPRCSTPPRMSATLNG
jgi:hypothetical protein